MRCGWALLPACYRGRSRLQRGRARAEKMVLKASDVHPEGYPTCRRRGHGQEAVGGDQRPADDSDVRLDAARGEKEAIEQAQVGAIQFARVSVGALGPVIDELQCFQPALPLPRPAHAQKVMDGSIDGAPRQGHQQQEKLGSSAVLDGCGARSMYDTKKPTTASRTSRG